jgi:hypothetical protein
MPNLSLPKTRTPFFSRAYGFYRLGVIEVSSLDLVTFSLLSSSQCIANHARITKERTRLTDTCLHSVDLH